MPNKSNNERVNRYATRSNMNRLRAAAGIVPSGRTESRLSNWRSVAEGENTARRVAESALASRMRANAPPFRPAASRRRNRRSRRNTRRANRR